MWYLLSLLLLCAGGRSCGLSREVLCSHLPGRPAIGVHISSSGRTGHQAGCLRPYPCIPAARYCRVQRAAWHKRGRSIPCPVLQCLGIPALCTGALEWPWQETGTWLRVLHWWGHCWTRGRELWRQGSALGWKLAGVARGRFCWHWASGGPWRVIRPFIDPMIGRWPRTDLSLEGLVDKFCFLERRLRFN